MPSIANAFRRAFGWPEDNSIWSNWEIKNRRRYDEPDELDDLGRFGYSEFEKINDYGFKELGFYDADRWFPICAECGSHVMPNRGQGMLCDSCAHDFEVHCAHDYNDFNF